MKVVHVTTWNERCGIATYAARLTRALAEIGVESSVIARRPLSERVDLSDLPLLGSYDPIDRPARAARSIASLCEPRAVVHLQFNFAVIPPPLLRALVPALEDRGCRVVTTMHALQSPHHRLFVWRTLPHLRSATLILLGLARFPAESVVGRFLRIEHLPHGVELRPKADREGLKRELGIDGDPLLATFGFCLPHKGLKQLVEALPKLARSHPGVRLIAACSRFPGKDSDTYIAECHRVASALGVSDRVRFLHDFLPESDVVRYLQAADLIVMNYGSTQESATGAGMLALGTGTPLAVSRAPLFDEMREHVRTLGDGELADEIARAIEEVRDPNAAGARRERLLADMSWAHVARRLEAIYERA